MAGNLSDYAENKILDHALATASWTMPTQLYLAAFTSSTTDAGGGTEVSGGSYARVAVDFDAAASGATQNATEYLFPQASADWGTVTHLALYDASSAGNMIWHGPANASKTIQTGDQLRVQDGELDISIN